MSCDGKEALRQQRRRVVDMHGDMRASRRDVMAANGAAGKDGEDGQKPAKRKFAGAAVGDGAVGAKTIRARTAIPSNQRASDSHDDTRLGDVQGVARPARAAHGAIERTPGPRRCRASTDAAQQSRVTTHHRLEPKDEHIRARITVKSILGMLRRLSCESAREMLLGFAIFARFPSENDEFRADRSLLHGNPVRPSD